MDQPAADARPRTRPPEPSPPESDRAARRSSTDTERPPPDSVRARQEQPSSGVRNETPASRASVPDSADGRFQAPQPRDARFTATDGTGLQPRPVSPASADRQRLAERLERIENPRDSRDALQGRLTHLEPGHPSSPWNEDGSPRPPAPRLSDLEQPRPPLSDREYAERRQRLADKLEAARAAGLMTDKLNALAPDYQEWTIERTRVHKEILNEKWQEITEVPCERKAIIAGGLGGSGKTTVLEQHKIHETSDYAKVDPDSFKEALARRDLIPRITGLAPMEASDLAHEESSYLARQHARRALAEGKNIIWDITMSTYNSTSQRIDELREAGYDQIGGIFVDIPIEVSVTRSEARHRRGCDRYLEGLGLGGRYVPAEVIRAQADPEFGSANRRAFEQLKERFDHWTLYENSVSGRQAALIDSSDRKDGDSLN